MSIFKRAIWRAVLYPYLFIVLCSALFMVTEYPSPVELTFITNPLVIYFYFLISFGGWCMIGFPIHGLAKIYFNSHKTVYFLALLCIFLMMTLSFDMTSAAIYCAPMLVQLILFLMFFDAFQKHNKPFKQDK